MKILIVEDDRAVARSLQLLLSECHYATDLAIDGKSGLELAEAFEYDLVLLDVLLPDLNGIDLCERLRAQGFQMPILLLTGQGGRGHQKAIALNAGADDYVDKPFDNEELTARIRALLRRGESKNQPLLRWGDLSIDLANEAVTYATQHLTLTPKEYAILELFLRNKRQVFNARMIIDRVWGSLECPGEEVVRVHIKELRKKLKQVSAPQDFIKTIHRFGYCLNPLYATVCAPNHGGRSPLSKVEKRNLSREASPASSISSRSPQAGLERDDRGLTIARQTVQQNSDPERQHLALTQPDEKGGGEDPAVVLEVSPQQQDPQQQALPDRTLGAIATVDDADPCIKANPSACDLFEFVLRRSGRIT